MAASGEILLTVATEKGWGVSRISADPAITTSELFQDAYDNWKDKVATEAAATTTTSSTLPD